jgi:CheY-like chemotaxis protein
MGGDIDVESEPGKGSHFFFTITVPAGPDFEEREDQSQAAPAKVPDPNPSRQADDDRPASPTHCEGAPVAANINSEPPAPPLSILVTEDNPVNQRIIQLLLKKLGHDPELVGNGREALERWMTMDFDLILMDVQMPCLDGYATTREIRNRESDNPDRLRVHICALTADAMSGDRERCIAAGMDEYLSKPIDPEKIATLLERIVERKAAAAGA